MPPLTKWTKLKYSNRSFWIGVPGEGVTCSPDLKSTLFGKKGFTNRHIKTENIVFKIISGPQSQQGGCNMLLLFVRVVT